MYAEAEKATNVSFLLSWRWKLQSICFTLVKILMNRMWIWLCMSFILSFIKKKTQPNAYIAK